VIYNSVGVVGQGFVGTAIKEGLKEKIHVETYDKYKDSTCANIEELCSKTKVIFICVPTPMKKDGSCGTFIVEEVVREVDSCATNKHIVIIKSTIPPGTTQKLNDKCKNLTVLFSPEFLTEANFIDDFKNQNRIIVGGPRPATTKIRTLFKKLFPKCAVIKTHSNTAEMVKYFTNCFLAVKVSFSNEIKQACDKLDIDYDKVVEYALYDERIGKSHLTVPGPDGKLGFGGSCFPKDINALIYVCTELNLHPRVLLAAWEKNLEVRPEKDWEQLKGRAVID